MKLNFKELSWNEQDLIKRLTERKFVFCEECINCDKKYPNVWQCPIRADSVGEGCFCENGILGSSYETDS